MISPNKVSLCQGIVSQIVVSKDPKEIFLVIWENYFPLAQTMHYSDMINTFNYKV